MKKLKYILVFAVSLLLVSCDEFVVEPRGGGEDDPVTIPPPPPPRP